METEDAIALAVGALVVGYSYATIRAAKKIIALRVTNRHNMEVSNLKIEAQNKFIMDINRGVDPNVALAEVLAAKEFIDLIEKSI